MREDTDPQPRTDGEDEEAELRALLQRVNQGDQEAAAELVHRFEPEVQRFVHFRLTDPRLRLLMDSLDICQSAFARFFVWLAEGKAKFETPHQLLAALRTIAQNRLCTHRRAQIAQRRGGQCYRIEDSRAVAEASAGASDPAEAVEASDLYDRIRDRLEPEDRELVDQRLAGAEWSRLTGRFGPSPDAVRKRFTRAIERAAEHLGLMELADEQ